MSTLLPLVALAVASSTAGGAVDTINAPKAAQARLAELIGSAETIESVTANDRSVELVLDTGGEALRVVVTVDPQGRVCALSTSDLGRASVEYGPYTWLSTAVSDAAAVTTLMVDAEGRVRLTTDRGDTYLVRPGPDTSNTAVEARWAAAWDAT